MIDYTQLVTAEMKSAKAAQEAVDAINKEALSYLASTDWMLIRQQELGVAVPQEVTDARAEARTNIVRTT